MDRCGAEKFPEVLKVLAPRWSGLGGTVCLAFFTPQAFLKVAFVEVLQQFRSYKLYFRISATSNLFFLFVFFNSSLVRPTATGIHKAIYSTLIDRTGSLVEPTKHLNASVLVHCSSQWARPMECPPILIRFCRNVERGNMVAFMSSC